jgi:AcrR family transcriptional regulator
MGRPREFEIDDAIDKATALFWRNGYEGTSLSDLTKTIGISPPSFYFAFGSKEALFRRAIERYFVEQNTIAEAAFRQPTARAVATHFLYGYADVLTDPGHAPGCLAMNSALPSAAGAPLREWLAGLREQMRQRLWDRFAEAREVERFPPGMDADALSRLVLILAWGMAVEAQSGATRTDLRRAIALALPVWPDAEPVTGSSAVTVP